MNILKVRGEDGHFINIPAIAGAPGEPGVHYGSEPPTNPDVRVWLDPTDDDTIDIDSVVGLKEALGVLEERVDELERSLAALRLMSPGI